MTEEYIHTATARARPPEPARVIDLDSLTTDELRALSELVVKTVCGSEETDSGYGLLLSVYFKIEAESIRRRLDEAGTQLQLFDPDTLS